MCVITVDNPDVVFVVLVSWPSYKLQAMQLHPTTTLAFSYHPSVTQTNAIIEGSEPCTIEGGHAMYPCSASERRKHFDM
jgi:hypothetical protein